jgi:uncharacterized membrane protein
MPEEQFIIFYFMIGFMLWLVAIMYIKETEIDELLISLVAAIIGWPIVLVIGAVSYINELRE